MSVKYSQAFSFADIPDSNALIVISCCQSFSIFRPIRTADRTSAAVRDLFDVDPVFVHLACLDINKANFSVITAAD